MAAVDAVKVFAAEYYSGAVAQSEQAQTTFQQYVCYTMLQSSSAFISIEWSVYVNPTQVLTTAGRAERYPVTRGDPVRAGSPAARGAGRAVARRHTGAHRHRPRVGTKCGHALLGPCERVD